MDSLRSFQLLSLFFLVFTFSASVFAFNMPRLGTQRRTTQHEPQTISSTSNLEDLKTYYYTQTLDHFNYRPDSYTTFKQRYVINSKYWGGANASAPIFAYLGAEEALDDDLPIIGFLSDNAPRFKALQVYIEHRYYGKSVPFGSMKAAMKNESTRGYFNSVQAIADYAVVLLHVKKKLSAENSPVIVIGGSYGGMLASWFRLKYPHIALGAVASSAPILYFDTIAPQAGYYSVVTKDFKTCSEMVMPIGHGSKDSMFPPAPFNLNKFINECKSLYGVMPQPHWVTTYYGGQDLKLTLHRFGSNIIFSNGLRDPYSSGGVLENISESILAVTTVNGSHCLDILVAKPSDPQWLVMQRKTEVKIIEKWIANYHNDLLAFK